MCDDSRRLFHSELVNAALNLLELEHDIFQAIAYKGKTGTRDENLGLCIVAAVIPEEIKELYMDSITEFHNDFSKRHDIDAVIKANFEKYEI